MGDADERVRTLEKLLGILALEVGNRTNPKALQVAGDALADPWDGLQVFEHGVTD